MRSKGVKIVLENTEMLSSIIRDVVVAVIAWSVISVIKHYFEKYRKTNDFTKTIIAFAVCEIIGVLSAVYGYVLFKKSVILAVILFVTSIACVILTIYMFFATEKAVNKSTRIIKEVAQKTSAEHRNDH